MGIGIGCADNGIIEFRLLIGCIFVGRQGDCLFWPFVQFVNFTFIPSPYRVMYINLVTCVYNIWLSIVKHNDEISQLIPFVGRSAVNPAAADEKSKK